MEAKLYGQNKGGMSINGIIKDYYAYAGENISAGDLVEYVNGVASKTEEISENIQLSTASKSAQSISAVQLDENRVFIAHSYSSSYYLYGVVVTIEGAKITVGVDTQLGTAKYVGRFVSAVLLPSGKVFIAFGGDSNDSGAGLKGTAVTIEETTVTYHGYYVLSTDSYSAVAISTCLLPNGNVFIAHQYGSSYHLYGIVCTIDGFVISKGTDTALEGSQYAGYAISTCLLPNGNVFIAHSYGSKYHLYGIVLSISGTTISKGSDTALNTNSYTGYSISTCLLPNGKVFIAHSYSTSYYLYGIVITISGTSITKGADTALNNVTGFTGHIISTCLLPNGKVFIVHSSSTNYNLYGMICTINGTTITKGSDTQLSNKTGAAYSVFALLLNDNVFTIHGVSVDTYLYAQIFAVDDNNTPTNNIITTDYETQVRKVTTGQFDGIAKTSGTGGDDTGHNDKVSIWTLVPIVTQQVTMADGNILADANGDIFLVREESA